MQLILSLLKERRTLQIKTTLGRLYSRFMVETKIKHVNIKQDLTRKKKRKRLQTNCKIGPELVARQQQHATMFRIKQTDPFLGEPR